MQTDTELSENKARLDVFPYLSNFIQNNGVPPKHLVWELEDSILKALDFFLSLPDLPGLADQKKKFLAMLPGHGRTNKLEIQQAAFWAEIRANYLLHKELGAEILGFEQSSPRGQRGKTCDILAKFDGNECFFEVKRKSRDVIQQIPTLLVTALTELQREIGFSVTPQLRQCDYDCKDLTTLISAIKDYLNTAERDYLGIPLPFRSKVIEVYFTVDGENTGDVWGEYVEPDLPQDIEKYLLGWRDGRFDLDKNGEPKIPKVGECRLKGADYLVTQIGFETPEEVAKGCFPDIMQLGEKEWATKDWRVAGLRGIVFFKRSFRTNLDWCLVRNSFQMGI